jgi:hypothetical protein
MGAQCRRHHPGRAHRPTLPTRHRTLDAQLRNLVLSVQLPITAKTAAAAVRQHWGIENTSHYSRDVTFREDASRIRKNPGIFARLRSFAYNILKSNQTDTIPQDRLAAAFGGLKSIFSMTFSKER